MKKLASIIVKLPLVGRLALVRDRDGEASGFPGGLSFHTNLAVRHIRDGKVVVERDLGSGLVTTAGVNFLATDFVDGTTDITTFDFHDSGTGIVAAAIADTGLGTPAGPARVSGTASSPAAGQYRTVATIAYTATLAITEWGLFNLSAAGTLWDRKVFAAINVVSGDSIQFTYTLTVNAGG